MRLLYLSLLSLLLWVCDGFNVHRNCRQNVNRIIQSPKFWHLKVAAADSPKIFMSTDKTKSINPKFLSVKFVIQLARNQLKNILKFIPVLGIVFQFKILKVVAATAAVASGVKGWDLYGRMPYDDWIFSNWILTDPDLLKRSFVETVVTELPDVYYNWKRQKRLYEAYSLVKGFGGFLIGFGIFGLIFKYANHLVQKRKERDNAALGFVLPTGAVYKNAQKKGKEIDGHEGWIDYDDEKDIPPKDPKDKGK